MLSIHSLVFDVIAFLLCLQFQYPLDLFVSETITEPYYCWQEIIYLIF